MWFILYFCLFSAPMNGLDKRQMTTIIAASQDSLLCYVDNLGYVRWKIDEQHLKIDQYKSGHYLVSGEVFLSSRRSNGYIRFSLTKMIGVYSIRSDTVEFTQTVEAIICNRNH